MNKDIEYDVTYDRVQKEHQIIIDLGDECCTLSRSQLVEMLNQLDEADDSL